MPIGAYKLNAISRRGSAAIAYDAVFKLIDANTNPNTNTVSSADGFGINSDLNDTYYIVGAVQEDTATTTDTGIAYVYSSTTRNLASTLVNPHPDSSGTMTQEWFGYAVGVSSSRAIVGQLGYYNTTVSSSNVYVYTASTGSLLYTFNDPYFVSGTISTFGRSVDISESYAIVGHTSAAAGVGQGRAYIYNMSTGSMLYDITNPAPTTGSGPGGVDQFGFDVAISDQYAAIAGGYNLNGNVYVYSTTTGNLVYTLNHATMTNTSSVDICNQYVIVGDISYNSFTGRAFVFNLSDGSLRNTIDNPNAYASVGDDWFGYEVKISDSFATVLALQEDSANSSSSNRGLSYIFNSATGALVQTLTSPFGNVSYNQIGLGITNQYAIMACVPALGDEKILFYSRITSDVGAGYLLDGYVAPGYVAPVE